MFRQSVGPFMRSYINPYTAELFVYILHSFEAVIANAISSFEWMKNSIIYEKWTSPMLNYSINCVSNTIYKYKYSDFYSASISQQDWDSMALWTKNSIQWGGP